MILNIYTPTPQAEVRDQVLHRLRGSLHNVPGQSHWFRRTAQLYEGKYNLSYLNIKFTLLQT